MSQAYDKICKLISAICYEHDKFSQAYLDTYEDSALNLKKKEVKDIMISDHEIIKYSFLQLIQDYLDQLGNLVVDLEYEYEYEDLDFRLRIKQKDSIVNKIYHYKFGKNEEGKVPLNKCLNDLLGLRIIVNSFDHNCEDFKSICENLKKDYKMTKINSSKDKYKATHVYFYGNNKYFPWELQIWDSSDSQQNETSHKEHKSKREYINWPQMYAKSNEYEYSKKGGDL
ncbi:hypothetical protein [Paenibacillus wynnii]|uniref:hypothetical protein n=1 Tax=Paenibacillus wynnii TaxID=268407 RepID=UPI00068B13FD|nr:hypothetical protein [Paenibacillus wynnii]